MKPLALTVTMPPHAWTEVAGMWVHVAALDDPLLGVPLHRVTVHRDADGHAWVQVAGPNAGVWVQSRPPDDHDFADADGGPL
jgi:hypothetical protein